MAVSERDMRIFWDLRAKDWYSHDVISTDYLIKVKNSLASYIRNIPFQGTVLDIAAGANNAVYYPDGFDMTNVTALDIAPKMLALNPSGHKILANVEHGLQLADNLFNRVVSVFGMRYFKNHEEVLLEAVRVTSPGGWVVFVDFDMSYISIEVNEFNAGLLAKFANSFGLKTVQEILHKPINIFDVQLDLLAVQKRP